MQRRHSVRSSKDSQALHTPKDSCTAGRQGEVHLAGRFTLLLHLRIGHACRSALSKFAATHSESGRRAA
eukprot:9440260-Pyramimonas_sp.AAC.1